MLYFFFSPHLALCAKCRVRLAWLIKRLLCRLNPKKTFSSCIWLHSFSLMQLAAATKCADLLFCPAHIYKSKLIRVSGHYLWLYSKQEPNTITWRICMYDHKGINMVNSHSFFKWNHFPQKGDSKMTQLYNPSDLGVNWLCLCVLAHFFMMKAKQDKMKMIRQSKPMMVPLCKI